MARKIGSLALMLTAAVIAGCSDNPMGPDAGAGAVSGSGGKPGPVPPPVEQKTVAWIQITPAGGTLPQAAGTSRQLGVVARAQDGTEIVGRPVTWSSSNATVASVSATGFLEAHAVGTAWVVAVVDGRRDSTLVSVPSLIARVETNPAQIALSIGDQRTLAAAAFDAQGNALARTYSWTSSNVAVATVDAAGRVTATGAGTALITATSEGKSASAKVTVTGQWWELKDVSGAPLPAMLYTDTAVVGGVATARRFQVTGGTLRIDGGRYELKLEGWLLVDGSDPVSTSMQYDGAVAYDVFTGAPLFFDGDDWANRTPRFRTRLRENGALEIDWSRQAGGPVVAIGFAR